MELAKLHPIQNKMSTELKLKESAQEIWDSTQTKQ